MKFYFKMALMPLFYCFFSAMLGIGIILLDEKHLALQFVLCVVNTAFYCVIMGVAGFKDGENAFKIRMQNDTYRRRIVQTGEDLPLQVHEEYKPWKGCVIALISAIPTVALVLIHVLINVASAEPSNTLGMITGIFNMVVFSYFLVGGSISATGITTWQYTFSLLYVPFICLVYGLPYFLGARKMSKQYDIIKATHFEIHGEDK